MTKDPAETEGRKRQRQQKQRTVLFFLLAILAFIAILLPASVTPNLFVFKPFGWNEVSQLLSFLLLIALFLERSLEVFINTWRSPEENEIANEIQSVNREIADLEEHINAKTKQTETIARMEEATPGNPPSSEPLMEVVKSAGEVENLRDTLSKKREELRRIQFKKTQYKSETRKIALWTGLFIGLLISGVGIRALETLITLQPLTAFPDGQKPIFYNGQVYIFRALDTLLTGGLIAGGSDGIHKLTQVFTTFLEESRDRMKEGSS